jgi:hypothetical protein
MQAGNSSKHDGNNVSHGMQKSKYLVDMQAGVSKQVQ